jgi:hypothetical protein
MKTQKSWAPGAKVQVSRVELGTDRWVVEAESQGQPICDLGMELFRRMGRGIRPEIALQPLVENAEQLLNRNVPVRFADQGFPPR